MFDLTSLFCSIDDFCKNFESLSIKPALPSSHFSKCRRHFSNSEAMTIIIAFHMKGYRNFKAFYLEYVCVYWKKEFPLLPSYNRMVELKREVLLLLGCYLHTLFGTCSGISFVDSTPLRVCHQKRIQSHKVFKGYAKRGKCSIGWFYGFKLHIIINDQGELLSCMVTDGSVNDRVPLHELLKRNITGKLFGDKGYISQELYNELFAKGVELITKIKKNMKNKLMHIWDKICLRKRGVVDSVIDQLKNISQIEHSRHRSIHNFLVNLFAGLIAYCFREKKPHLDIRRNEVPNSLITV